ncbi:MAG TPA: SCP2 sterol-binding domain-containing protein [Amycolatopsis sp.]|nr:SCP2 sterol-binding domain-containing protein [Amycolatopsis sp.]
MDVAGLRGKALLDALDRVDVSALDVNQVADAIDPRELGHDDFRRLLDTLIRLSAEAPAFALAKVDPMRFATLVSRASRAQLEAVVASRPLRERVLDEIFARMGSHLRVDRARSVEAVVRWRLTDGAGGYDRYATEISGGSCTVSRTSEARPRVTITLSPVDFFRLITHQATPAVLFVTGKIKVKGDLAFAAGLIGYFDLPKPG